MAHATVVGNESSTCTDLESVSSTSTSQLKTLFKELLDETKNDIITVVKQNIDQIYTDFDTVAIDNEAECSCIAESSDPGLVDKIDSFLQPVHPQADNVPQNQDSTCVEEPFKTLAEEFSVLERTSALSSAGLAVIGKDKLPSDTLQTVQPKYVRPENCTNLVPSKLTNRFGSKCGKRPVTVMLHCRKLKG